VRRYRPFLIYNPAKGWGFYPNHYASPLTSRSIGSNRKVMRRPIGWFATAQMAAIFEAAERRPV